jgi:hypothetical protein
MFANKKFLAALAALTTLSASALELTIINTGNKTGSNSVESFSYTKDLSTAHKIEFISPGDGCVAHGIMTKTPGPVLFGWANDREAMGRNGTGCATVDVAPKEIIRHTRDPMYVCTMKPEFNAKEFVRPGAANRVGVTSPDHAFSRVVRAVNQSFGTMHKPIAYLGTGAVKVALFNNEVDYAFLGARLIKEVEANKGRCLYVMNNEDRMGFPAIGKLDPKNKELIGGFSTIWLLKNADAKTVQTMRKEIQAIHDNPNSAYNTAFKNVIPMDWNATPEQQKADWENSVESMR